MSLTHLPAVYATEGQGSAPLCAGVESGIFEGYGLDVSLTMSGNAENVVRDLMNGTALFGTLAAPALVRAAARGADLAFYAGGVNQHFLVGAPGVIDVSTLGSDARFAGAGRGDLADFFTEFTFLNIMSQRGRYVDVAGRDRVTALLDGRLDATPLSTPLAVQARSAGCNWLVDFADFDLNFAVGGLAARRSFVRSNPGLTDLFLSAYVAGTKYYKANRDFGIGVHERYSGIDGQIAAITYDVTHAGFPDCPDPATPGLRRLVAFMRETSALVTPIELEDVIDSGPISRVCLSLK